jgi:hypothetical protein
MNDLKFGPTLALRASAAFVLSACLTGCLAGGGDPPPPTGQGVGVVADQPTPGAPGVPPIPGVVAPATPVDPNAPVVPGEQTPATPLDPSIPVTPATPGVTPTPVDPAAPATPGAAVSCSNADTSIIPVDETGWVARPCTDYGIQGAFYCYDDGVNPSGCTANTVPYTAGSGMCLTGNTTVDDTYAAWGAGIGFSLNESGEVDGAASVKMPFNATAAGVTGFNIKITGDAGGLPIRVNFTKVAAPDGPSPFVAVPGTSTTGYDVLIADALIPASWDACTGDDCLADPTSIYDIQIQVVGGDEAANYNVCVESIVPITDGSTPAVQNNTLSDFGSALCGTLGTINIGPYMAQNNAYNTASHCIQARWDNGSTGGFNLTNVSANVEVGGAPASYPSLVYGWHVDGLFHGNAYTSAKQLSAIGSAPTTMAFTVPGAGRYNVSYDNWIGPSANPSNEQNTLEHMIWLNYRETTPIGSSVASVNIAGIEWDVWYGPNNGWNTVSYIRATNTTSATLDLNDFFQDSIARGYTSGSDYLLGVQAGFEIWEASQNFSVDSFSVSVN